MQIAKNGRYYAALEKALASIDCSALRGKTCMVTGAVGMLGSCLVDALREVGCNVLAVGRNGRAAQDRFGPPTRSYTFLQQDVRMPITGILGSVEYVIHAAGNADPIRFSTQPVDTVMANVQGTDNLMRFGLEHGMKRFLYVSSGEVYGHPDAALNDFIEDYCGPLDLSDPRSCYPAGKRAAEVLCQSYHRQYGVDVVIVRPCHLFGPTMTRRDSRAVSEFLWDAVEGRDIVLKSAGLLERSHCYVVDGAVALLLALLNGDCGAAYNIADRRYQMRIGEFAEQAASVGGCRVVYQAPSEAERAGCSKASRMVLDAGRMERLGWRPGTKSAIEETVAILRECGACCE